MSAAAPARSAPPRVVSLAEAVLERFAGGATSAPDASDCDPGPLVLAALVAQRKGSALHEGVVARWLEQLSDLLRAGTLEFGPTGPFAGLAAAARTPRLGRLHRSLWDQVAAGLPRNLWRTREISWADYDLICGPSAMLLGVAASGRLDAAGAAARRRLAVRCARQLLALCDGKGLGSLRLRRDLGDAHLRFNEGRINTGVAHGVAGIGLALRSAIEHSLAPAAPLRAELGRLADWLVASSYVDRSGLRTWPLASLDGASPAAATPRPQAWCYGTPGIAWSLWECGRVLRRRDLSAFALEAFESWCERVEPGLDRAKDLSDQLGLCHGVAGMLAIADAFARHASSRPAAARAGALERLLLRELDAVASLADDLTLLTGIPGILAVLLTRRGASRQWMRPFGLR